MAAKRSNQPELTAFGEFLAGFRSARAGRRRVSREQISRQLKNLGVPLGGSTLAQYEKGWVWAPDPGVLWGLSRIYETPVDEIIQALKANRSDPSLTVQKLRDLLRHAADQEQILHHTGGSDVPASAQSRLQKLEADREAFVSALHDVAVRAVKGLAERGEQISFEDAPTGTAAPGVRRRVRQSR